MIHEHYTELEAHHVKPPLGRSTREMRPKPASSELFEALHRAGRDSQSESCPEPLCQAGPGRLSGRPDRG